MNEEDLVDLLNTLRENFYHSNFNAEWSHYAVFFQRIWIFLDDDFVILSKER